MTERHVIISRTDRIGDVVLTLPLAGALKELVGSVRITFLGASYTQSIVEACPYVDEFVAWDHIQDNPVEALKALKADVILHVFPNADIAKAAKQAGIPLRVGTRNRLFHWFSCNQLLTLSRKNSNLHESQLNLFFLKAFGINRSFSLEEVYSFQSLVPRFPLTSETQKLFDKNRFNLILHPKSKGSAQEWPIEHFIELARLLPPDQFKLFITGTQSEGLACAPLLKAGFPHVHDVTGQFSLAEFMAFIAAADSLVAASTGPVHVAAALGITTIGLFPSRRPTHPGRWRPLGPLVRVLTPQIPCPVCGSKEGCQCMSDISPNAVAQTLAELSGLTFTLAKANL